MKQKFIMRSTLLLLTMGLLMSVSCKKKDSPDPPSGEITNADINQWVVDSMRVYYYWAAQIPTNQNLNMNLEPEPFFESILNRPTDRFSWIQNAQELKENLSGIIKTSGINYAFFGIRTGNTVTHAGISIRYVLKGSPADLAGVKRGDLFIRLNDQQMTVNSEGFVQGIDALRGNDPFTLTKAYIEGNTIVETNEKVTLTPIENFVEKAIHMDTVFTTTNGTKVGYIFYNRYLSTQGQELVTTFAKFKAAGVQQLIVDQRYNSGGSVAIAALLSGMIHKDFNPNAGFLRYEFNPRLGNIDYTYLDILGSNNANVARNNNLGLDKVYILATNSSASASEMLINNLKPFLGNANVIHIGGVTSGKDQGSYTIENKSGRFKGEDAWGIQPIVFKYKNAAGVGDFTDGLVPQHTVAEGFPLMSMGNLNDPLIAKAMSLIDPSMVGLLQKEMTVRAGQRAVIYPEIVKETLRHNPVRPVDGTDQIKGRKLELK
jgi:carboxyl-terminal processing protease